MTELQSLEALKPLVGRKDCWYIVLALDPDRPAEQSLLRVSGGLFSACEKPFLTFQQSGIGMQVVMAGEIAFEQGLLALRHFATTIDQTFSFIAIKSLSAPGAVFFDMDATVVKQESIVELAKLAHAEEEVRAVTEAAMNGELDFAEALHRRVSCLKGVEQVRVDGLYKTLTLNPGLKELTSYLASKKMSTYLVSGGFHELAVPLNKEESLAFSGIHANSLESSEGKLTGRTAGPLVDAMAKANYLIEKTKDLHAPVWAVGDGANDIEMFKAADMGIAYHPKAALIEHSAGVNRTESHFFLKGLLQVIAAL